MSRLLKYTPWLTLADAATYLSSVENVTETDLLLLALEGQLKISARFVCPVAATAGTIIEPISFTGEIIQEDSCPIFPGIEGVFDLRLTTPQTVRLNSNRDLESCLFGLEFSTDVPGRVVRIDTLTLPETAHWVIRSNDLLEFKSKLEEVSNQPPAPPIEETPMLGTSEPLRAKGEPDTKAYRQDQAILDMLKQLDYDPKALPPRQPGYPWVKAEVKTAALPNRKDLFTDSSFGKTWERLRRNGEIIDQS